MIGRILAGVFIIGVGVLIIVNAYSMVKMFGKIRWAENNVGSTKDFYVLVGCGCIVVGILTMFGLIGMGIPEDAVPLDL